MLGTSCHENWRKSGRSRRKRKTRFYGYFFVENVIDRRILRHITDRGMTILGGKEK